MGKGEKNVKKTTKMQATPATSSISSTLDGIIPNNYIIIFLKKKETLQKQKSFLLRNWILKALKRALMICFAS